MAPRGWTKREKENEVLDEDCWTKRHRILNGNDGGEADDQGVRGRQSAGIVGDDVLGVGVALLAADLEDHFGARPDLHHQVLDLAIVHEKQTMEETIGLVYKRIMAIATTDPFHLADGIVSRLHELLGQYIELCRIRRESPPENTHHRGYHISDLELAFFGMDAFALFFLDTGQFRFGWKNEQNFSDDLFGGYSC